ncbi:hypothetical protein ABN097_06245 [Enterobacter cloacae]|uniref:hypothetical protein n=1 Tax=Enterobacter cloacae TaxID=550 RepID=UPI0032D9CFE6
MTTRQIKSAAEAIQIIQDATVRKIELAFDINADEFFTLARLAGERGGKIIKPGEFFVVSL